MKKSSNPSLKKVLLIYLSSIKTKLAIKFLKKNLCTWPKIGLALKGLTLSRLGLFSAKYKSFFFFFRKVIASLVFMLERYIRRTFLEKGLNFFHIKKKKKMKPEMRYVDKYP